MNIYAYTCYMCAKFELPIIKILALTTALTHIDKRQLSAQYWGELRPDSPTYARFPNLLYTAELLCIKQK